MIKRAVLTIILILSLLFSNDVKSFSVDTEYVMKHQERFSVRLNNPDINKLIQFSENEINFGKDIKYSTDVQLLINKLSKARDDFEKSNVALSYNEYRDILKTMKPNDFYYMLIANNLLEIGFFTLSQEAIEKIEDREIWQTHIDSIRDYFFPTLTLKVPEEIFLGEIYADIVYNNLTEESIDRLEKAEKVLANSDYASYLRAKAFFNEKKYKKSLNEINKALAKNSDNINYKKFKAEILGIMNRNKECLETLKSVDRKEIIFFNINKDMEKIKYYTLSSSAKKAEDKKYNLAYYFYLNRDYQRAINELNALILKGKNKKAPELLGKIYKIMNNYAEAENLFDKYIIKNPKNAFAHKGKGDIYLGEKKYKEALEEYKLAYRYDKKDIESLIAIAGIKYKTGDIEESKKYLKRASRKDKNNFKILYLNSKIMPEREEEYIKQTLRYNPFYSEGWLDMVKLALNNKEAGLAERYINIAAFIEESPGYFYYKSKLSLIKGNIETAEKEIELAEQSIKEKGKTDYDEI